MAEASNFARREAGDADQTGAVPLYDNAQTVQRPDAATITPAAEAPDARPMIGSGVAAYVSVEGGAEPAESDKADPEDAVPKSDMPVRRTPGIYTESIARSPHYEQRDFEIRALDSARAALADPKERGQIHQRAKAVRREVATDIASLYGVDPQEITHLASNQVDMALPFAGNNVRLSVREGSVGVTSWGQGVSREQQDAVVREHRSLRSEGDDIVVLRNHAPAGTIPSHLIDLYNDIIWDGGSLEAAYAGHVEQVRGHAAAHGYSDFQINSSDLRMALPIALHLLQQPHADREAIVGDYSTTNGLLVVDGPGIFSHPASEDVSWVVTVGGRIARLKPSS